MSEILNVEVIENDTNQNIYHSDISQLRLEWIKQTGYWAHHQNQSCVQSINNFLFNQSPKDGGKQ